MKPEPCLIATTSPETLTPAPLVIETVSPDTLTPAPDTIDIKAPLFVTANLPESSSIANMLPDCDVRNTPL